MQVQGGKGCLLPCLKGCMPLVNIGQGIKMLQAWAVQ